jgi:hypothetical protein
MNNWLIVKHNINAMNNNHGVSELNPDSLPIVLMSCKFK